MLTTFFERVLLSFFFDVDLFKKKLLNLLQCFFCCLQNICGILVSRPGIEPAPPALEGEVLTTGPPVKSPVKESFE